MRSLPPVGSVRSLSLGVAMALPVSPASALFIVNQPWVRPAQVGQSTEAYMNLTSTDGAKLVGVATRCRPTATIRAPGKAIVMVSSVGCRRECWSRSHRVVPDRIEFAAADLEAGRPAGCDPDD